jgi:hypothetical protein
MDGTGSAGPAQPAPACAAATVLLVRQPHFVL